MILEIEVERTQVTTLYLNIEVPSKLNKEMVELGIKDSVDDDEWENPVITDYTVIGEARPEDAELFRVADANDWRYHE